MIEKLELQTGNLVTFQNSVYTIKRSDLEFDDLFQHFNPIITSVQWLGFFGFDIVNSVLEKEAFRHPNYQKLFVTMKDGIAFEIVTQSGKNDWHTLAINIYYVHLLQNKWRIIVGKDLVLNLIK